MASEGAPLSIPPTQQQQQCLDIPLQLPVLNLGISPDGNRVVMAAKRGMYILDLDQPFSAPAIIHHQSKWDVTDCMWNPHASHAHWIASTCNQKALVWRVEHSTCGGNASDMQEDSASATSSGSVQYVLNAHTRAISDLNWSPFVPEMLATCSYDAYVHCWDLRLNKDTPALSFCAWTAGATQVKWNRMSEYLLASSHDTSVRVWDIRKGSSPLTLITAHYSKIYGIDWSRNNEAELVTCSQDQTVKVWDVTQPRVTQVTLQLSAPAWRARWTPFGRGIMTMPQKKETSLCMWAIGSNSATIGQGGTPIVSYCGHTDTPTEFVWRKRGENEYQMVTWGKDHHLRVWPVSQEHLLAVGHSSPMRSDEILVGSGGSLGNDDDLDYVQRVRLGQRHSGVIMGSGDVALRPFNSSMHKRPSLVDSVHSSETSSTATDSLTTSPLPQTNDVVLGDPNPIGRRQSEQVLGRSFSNESDILYPFASGTSSRPNAAHVDGSDFENDDDDSDESFSDEKLDSLRSKSSNTIFQRMKKVTGPLLYPKFDSTPYPCLCGASFTATGKLVAFFSHLPHPSSTKFSENAAFASMSSLKGLVTTSSHAAMNSRRDPVNLTMTSASSPEISQPKTFASFERFKAYLDDRKVAKGWLDESPMAATTKSAALSRKYKGNGALRRIWFADMRYDPPESNGNDDEDDEDEGDDDNEGDGQSVSSDRDSDLKSIHPPSLMLSATSLLSAKSEFFKKWKQFRLDPILPRKDGLNFPSSSSVAAPSMDQQEGSKKNISSRKRRNSHSNMDELLSTDMAGALLLRSAQPSEGILPQPFIRRRSQTLTNLAHSIKTKKEAIADNSGIVGSFPLSVEESPSYKPQDGSQLQPQPSKFRVHIWQADFKLNQQYKYAVLVSSNSALTVSLNSADHPPLVLRCLKYMQALSDNLMLKELWQVVAFACLELYANPPVSVSIAVQVLSCILDGLARSQDMQMISLISTVLCGFLKAPKHQSRVDTINYAYFAHGDRNPANSSVVEVKKGVKDRLKMTRHAKVDIRNMALASLLKRHSYALTIYAERLFDWGCYSAAAEQRKSLAMIEMSLVPSSEKLLEPPRAFINSAALICPRCDVVLNAFAMKCSSCTRSLLGISCVICQCPCTGSYSYCRQCTHGGHIEHLQLWFGSGESICPSGGCFCECGKWQWEENGGIEKEGDVEEVEEKLPT